MHTFLRKTERRSEEQQVFPRILSARKKRIYD